MDDSSTPAYKFSFRTEIQAENVVTKDVILLIFKIDLRGSNNFGITHTEIDDYFFSDDVLRANESTYVQASLGPITPQNLAPDQSVPSATARVRFVEFGDGSTWGDIDAGRDAILERRLTWVELKRLDQIRQQHGETAFLEELTKSSTLQTIRHLQNVYRTRNSVIVVSQLSRMLANAELHHEKRKTGTVP